VAANIYLIGPLGAGKTAVGRQLARLLGRRFIDCDAEIEQRTGVDIPFIFEKEGEAGFREREKEALAAISELDGAVVATGGGAVLDPANRARLKASGTVIFLRTSVEEQLLRTRRTGHRPLLAGKNPHEVLARLMAIRTPLYEEIADLTLDTNGRRVRSVAAALRDRLRERGLVPLQN
jgi:shikimate kinase